MTEWIDRLAHELGQAPLTPAETSTLLAAARDVAHRVERRLTPLSTFLVGAAVERATAAGAPRERALRDALAAMAAVMPSADSNDARDDRGGR